MNAIARKALAAVCALAVTVPVMQTPAQAAVVDDPSVVTVTADEVGPFFHNVELDKGRISSLKFTDPASVGGTQDSSFYIDFRFNGQRSVANGTNTQVDTRKDGDVQVVTMRNRDTDLGVDWTREFRIDGNKITVRVEVENTSGSDSYFQLDMTNQINTARTLHGAYDNGVFTVGPEFGGYDTHLTFDGAYSNGVSASFNGTTEDGEVGSVDPEGAMFQRGRWIEEIAAGQTATAEATIEVTTQDTAVDSDGDGLPNAWEEQGLTLDDGTPMPLNEWGADPNRPDVFLQMNWMPSEFESLGCFDNPRQRACADANTKSYRPNNEILQQLVDKFDAHGVNLHIDAGESYSNIPNYTERHGGVYGEYTPYYFAGVTPGVKLMDNIDGLLGNRSAVFRSGMVGDSMSPNNYSVGLSLMGDNAFYVANHERMTTDEQFRNTIMHELGHTLGLDHNGSTKFANEVPDSDYLPNYYSVMNYLYQFSHFDYSDEEAVSGGELPRECNRAGVNCYTGDYRVPADWDNLVINTGHIGKPVGTAGVSGASAADGNDVQPSDARAKEIAAAEAANGTADVTVNSSDLQAGKPGEVTLTVKNPGADLNRYEIEVITPDAEFSDSVVLDGVFGDSNSVTVTVPVLPGNAAIMPVDVKVTNAKGTTAFEDRFAVDVATNRDDAPSAAMAGAANTGVAEAPKQAKQTKQTKEQAPAEAPAKQDAAPKTNSQTMTTVAAPEKANDKANNKTVEEQPKNEPAQKQQPAKDSTSGKSEGTNVAAIVVPIIALLAIIGGIAAAVGSGMLG